MFHDDPIINQAYENEYWENYFWEFLDCRFGTIFRKFINYRSYSYIILPFIKNGLYVSYSVKLKVLLYVSFVFTMFSDISELLFVF